MGVLACDRKGCEHIMCDHYSHTHGYICDDCLKELKAYLLQSLPNGCTDWIHPITEEFMNLTKPAASSDVSKEVEEFIENEFKIR